MMKKTIAILILLGSFFAYGQKEASNWFFGENAGIKFNLDTNTLSTSTDGKIFTREGCSSISDESGNLLFYTDGTTVYNKQHQVMQNGFDLYGDNSSSQSAIVVPKPNDENIYYVFTVGSNQTKTGLNYSVIDITLDNGLGSVIEKNTSLLGACSEKITAVLKDCITKDIWVVTFSSEDGVSDYLNTYYAFEVSSLGVNNTPVKTKFNTFIGDLRGYLKLSPDGKKVASAHIEDGLYIYDFETSTGVLSNEQRLEIRSSNGSIYPYGVEFSPDSKLLYVNSYNNFSAGNNQEARNNPVNHKSTLTQFNISSTNIQASEITIDERQLYRGALQLGPDGKIYRALNATYDLGLGYLGVIENPNSIGLSCSYQHNAVNLSPFKSSQGLPPFIASFFNEEIDIIKNGQSSSNLILCEGDTYKLASENISNATYIWTLNDVTLPNISYDLEVTRSGNYKVYIVPNNGDCAIEGKAYVQFNPKPATYNHTLLQCDEDGVKDGYTLFNLNEANGSLTNNIPNLLTKFYSDSARTKEINGDSYKNTSNPQTIYVDVINNSTGCFNTCTLTIQVSITDANDVALTPLCDDDGIEDGLHVFNLNDAKNSIINGLSTVLNISFYATYNDALLEINTLNTSFTNTQPYSQTIYARVENNNNCYGISTVQLTVYKLPNIEAERTAYYCLNKFPETITLNAGLLNDLPNNYTYNWSTNEATYEIEVNQSGIFTVEVINANGCSKTKTITVLSSNIATIQRIDIDDVTTQNNTITVLVSGEGVYEYALYDEFDVQIKEYQESSYFENVKGGIYNVYVKDVKNDCGEISEKASVISYPKFFTPNGDGFNDTWQIYGVSSMFQPNTKIQIFNRFGRLMKEISPISEGWNGTINGDVLPADDYWFTVKLQDGRIFKNHFSLKR